MKLSAATPIARPTWVAATAAGLLIVLVWYLHVVGEIPRPIPAGIFSLPIETLRGEWLNDLVVRTISALPPDWPLNTVLAAVTAGILGFLIGWLYQRLIYNDWTHVEALLLVGLLGTNAIVVGMVMGDHRPVATMIACIAVIPGIRRIESVGDVQANMSFGLVLPLLFLAGPATTPLILPLCLFGALADPEARHDLRAFIAMFLVAIMPTLLVLTGMLGMFGSHEFVRLVQEIYVPAYTPDRLGAASTQALLTVAAYTVLPFVIITVAYMLVRDRRWQPVSALSVIMLPLYLVAGAVVFSWPMSSTLPTAAFLGAFASWLSVARLSTVCRWVSIALMLLTAVLSWSPVVLAALAPQ
jgi:hypothetical protein